MAVPVGRPPLARRHHSPRRMGSKMTSLDVQERPMCPHGAGGREGLARLSASTRGTMSGLPQIGSALRGFQRVLVEPSDLQSFLRAGSVAAWRHPRGALRGAGISGSPSRTSRETRYFRYERAVESCGAAARKSVASNPSQPTPSKRRGQGWRQRQARCADRMKESA